MKKVDCRQILACRLCDETKLSTLIKFGNIPLGNNLLKNQNDSIAAESFPLELKQCQNCHHFQLGHAVAPNVLYATNYTYLSGVAASFRKHFQDYSIWIQRKTNLKDHSSVLDIGSNDGTCLEFFKKKGFRVYGVDPADMPVQIANSKGIKTLKGFFDKEMYKELVAMSGNFDLVTSHNVLAHVDNLRETFVLIKKLLKRNGWFCFEVGYFREVLKDGLFDTIYHEHLDYHHAYPLVEHLTNLGFDIVDISVNDIQGGTLRILSKKTGNGDLSVKARKFLKEELASPLYNRSYLYNWEHSIKARMKELKKNIHYYRKKGFKVIGYGAPTKATLLIKLSELSQNDIEFVIEDNPLKVDRFLPGTGIPIKDSSQLNKEEFDIILLFAWNFYDDIKLRLTQKLSKPTKILIPLPTFRKVEIC